MQVAACFTHPLDLTKVSVLFKLISLPMLISNALSRMQTLETGTTATKPSTLAILRATLAESGIRSLYTGLTASLMRHMTYSLVRLGIYDKIKLRIVERTKREPTAIQLILAAGVSGGLGGLVGNPAGESHLSYLDSKANA
jgi:solute carrier family 25 (mitochondrial dicarboxylate transporter), member 10